MLVHGSMYLLLVGSSLKLVLARCMVYHRELASFRWSSVSSMFFMMPISSPVSINILAPSLHPNLGKLSLTLFLYLDPGLL